MPVVSETTVPRFSVALLVVAIASVLVAPASSAETGSCRAIGFTASSAYSGASRVVAEWVAAWRADRFARMAALSQVSWRRRTQGATSLLRDQYGFKDPVGFRITRVRRITGVAAEVTFRVDYRTFKVEHVLIAAMVIREDRNGNPSPAGAWGVNPISTLRESPAC